MRLIFSSALSIKRYVVLLRLLLRGMRRAPATEPATIGHGEYFVKETRLVAVAVAIDNCTGPIFTCQL